MYDVCRHVLSRQILRELQRKQNVQFRRFLYCMRDSVCNTIRSPCDETWTNVQEQKFNQRLWTSLFGLHVRCGAFIQCDGESATDLRAVRYRARANWIGPEPDSVLRSVRSLILTAVPTPVHVYTCFGSRSCSYQKKNK